MITVATAPTAATTATRIASGRSVTVVGRGIAGEGGTGAAMARVPLGLDVAAGELLEQPVDRVEERLRDVPRQRVTDRVLRAVGGAGTHRGPTELDDLVVPQPVGKRLEVPEPAVMPAVPRRRHHPVPRPCGGQRGLVDRRALVAGGAAPGDVHSADGPGSGEFGSAGGRT